MIVICKDNSLAHLTIGKEYKVVSEEGKCYLIYNDYNSRDFYDKTRFTFKKETPSIPEILAKYPEAKAALVELGLAEELIMAGRITINGINAITADDGDILLNTSSFTFQIEGDRLVVNKNNQP